MYQLKYLFHTLFILLFLNSINAQNETSSAQWITHPTEKSAKNQWFAYRKTVVLPKKPTETVKVHIACDSKYWLWVNEKLVVFEGQLKRGPTPNDTYFDVVELAPYLKKGKNTIAILHWYFGKNGFSHKSSAKAGLLFDIQTQQLDASLKVASSFSSASSSRDWKVIKHPAFLSESSNPQPNFRLSESNIHFDARLDINNWFSSKYDDSKWANALEVGKAPCAPWGNLWARPIPFWYDSGLVSYATMSKKIGEKQDTIVGFLPKNRTITPYLEVEAQGGERIEIRTDNYNGGSAPNVRTDYICKKGKQRFETFGFMNGHEVWYIVPKTVKISTLKYRETRYNTEGVGFFNSNDVALNKLWEKSRNTLDISMRDNYMDCPDRERAQWWGDVVLQIGETFYAYDRRADLLTKKAISNLLEWQKPDSVLFSPVPAGNWDKELPGQVLATIWGIKDYFDHSGDTATMRYAYPFVKKYMDLWQIDSNNLVIHREGGWMWHDWGDHVDVPVLDNIWYYRALESLEKMAQLSKNTEGSFQATIKKEKLKNAFQKHFWNGKVFVSKAFEKAHSDAKSKKIQAGNKFPDYVYVADDRANGLAVVAGLTHAEQWSSIKTLLDTTFHAGPYLEKYILEAYFSKNETQAGLERMKNRYATMIKSPITTLWEGWEVGSATYGGGTYNHGWTGGPLTLLSQYIGGLSPSTEGYETFKIMPQPADLTYFKMGAETTKGFSTVEWKRGKNKAILSIKTPNTKGKIGIPKVFPFSKILLNGKKIWEKGQNTEDTSRNNREGGIFLEETTHHFVFEVAAGNYVFDME